jgi:peptidyl-prolyl cis-trans isomerase SurA
MKAIAALLSPVVVVAACLACAPADAQTTIKVLANGIPITSYDISQRTRLKTLANEKGGAKGATDELIEEALMLYEGKQRGVAVPEISVDNAFNDIAKQVKLSPSQFGQALTQQGVNPKTLKGRLRAQIVWYSLVQQRMQRASPVSSKDVDKELAAGGEAKKQVTTSEFILKQIIFVVPKGSSSGYTAQRRREAESFRLRFGGCEKAVELSKGLRDVAVRDMGRRNTQELTGAQGDAIKKTPVGKTTAPSTTDKGVELVAVCSKRDMQSESQARAAVEYKLAQKVGGDVAKDYLKELKDKAVIEYR